MNLHDAWQAEGYAGSSAGSVVEANTGKGKEAEERAVEEVLGRVRLLRNVCEHHGGRGATAAKDEGAAPELAASEDGGGAPENGSSRAPDFGRNAALKAGAETEGLKEVASGGGGVQGQVCVAVYGRERTCVRAWVWI